MRRMYRIYTQDLNRGGIIALLQTKGINATLIYAHGVWEGMTEPSLVIEILTDSSLSAFQKVNDLARDIKRLNAQQEVLVIAQKVRSSWTV